MMPIGGAAARPRLDLDMPSTRPWLIPLSVAVGVALVISGVHPYERSTWLMEIAPVLVVFPLLALTARRFPLTSLLYLLIAAQATLLIVGGAYTYARVPIGAWVQQWFDLSRNPYDKLGHFAQGLVPALAAREVFVRQGIVRGRSWIAVLAATVALSVSLLYELVEWGAALALGQGADAFLGMQGDPWDTQSDMGLAVLGALVGVLLLVGIHDRQLVRMTNLDADAEAT